MQMTKTTKILLTILAISLAGAALHFYTKYFTNTNEPIVGEEEFMPSSEAETQFITLTSKIDSISFDTSILQDPRFKELKDIRVMVDPEKPGRKDPFAPSSGVR